MKTKIFFGGLAGGLTFFLLGWLIYGILLMNFTAANSNQSAMRQIQDMIWWALILSNFIIGLLLSLVLSWSKTTEIMAGAKVAGIVGLMVSSSMDLSYYAMSTIYANFTYIFVDVIAATFISSICGIVIVWVMRLGKKVVQ